MTTIIKSNQWKQIYNTLRNIYNMIHKNHPNYTIAYNIDNNEYSIIMRGE